MLYLEWQDLAPKKTDADKITEAAAAYRERFQHAPNVVLVSPAAAAGLPPTMDGMAVRAEGRVRQYVFFVGEE